VFDTFGILVRHFFGRFFDTESLSPQSDPVASLSHVLGLLAVPGVFFVLLFRPLGVRRWDLVMVRYIFVSLSMLVMGFVMVFEWDALFPDRRDYYILTPLPLNLSTLFLAKAAALALFLSVFLAAVNGFSILMWPGIDGGEDAVAIITTHAAVVLAGGLFMALAIAALHGILVTVFSGRFYQRLSVMMQTLVMAVLVMLFFLTLLLGYRAREYVRTDHPLLHLYPGYWFLGLYEQFRPTTRDPLLRTLAKQAWLALGVAAAAFVLTFLPLYRRHARRVVEAAQPAATGPSTLRRMFEALINRFAARKPAERAVFHFITETITRSTKHRLFLATYSGFGAALAVMHLGSDQFGLLRLPLTLSFILVSGLRAAFNFPSELPANWSFQIADSGQSADCRNATRRWLISCGILPLFLLLAPMEFVCFPWRGAAFHIIFGISLSLLLAEVMFAGFRKVPFTCTYFAGKINLTGSIALYVLGFTTYSEWMAQAEVWLWQFPGAAIASVAGLLAARWALAFWLRRTEGEGLDYVEDEPEIRTLSIEYR
jgi:hypothetical protein